MDSYTPICDFIKRYNKDGSSRFHMPGHKGTPALNYELSDITEIQGADSLYNPTGIIALSEQIASGIFGTRNTLYSVEGSSQCIRAMLSLISLYARKTGRKPSILAPRNAHRVFGLTCALLDIEVIWLNCENSDGLLSAVPTPEEAKKGITSLDSPPTAVYITSPDYLGNMADIKGISQIAHKYGCLFAVDNAHGSYLKFSGDLHPMDGGADICCDSAHKTLPVLTGGAYLHISRTAPEILSENAKNAMAAFGSTSPSYLILQSLDNFNGLIKKGYADKIKECKEKVKNFKREITSLGWRVLDGEPLKITICAKESGWTGCELEELFIKNKIMCEYCDPDYLVLMVSPENGEKDFKRLKKTLQNIPVKAAVKREKLDLNPTSAMSMRTAFLKESEEIPTEKSLGRIISTPTANCPPGVPVLYGGEIITQSALKVFDYYKINKVQVIK